MFPYFMLFGKMITSYFLLAVIGAFAAGIFACVIAGKRKIDDNNVIVTLLFAAIGVFLGGHILYGITNIKYIPLLFTANSFSQFITRFQAVFGGAIFYGGLFGGVLAAYIYIRIKKLPLGIYADLLTPSIPLFHCFARIGCFLGGCCYGIESKFGFTVTNNKLVPSINGVSRFPVQLLESLLNLILFFIMFYIYKKSITHKYLQGKLLFIYFACYAIIRFWDEFLRGDEIRGFVFGFSTSQFISIILFAVSSVVLTLWHFKGKAVSQNKFSNKNHNA